MKVILSSHSQLKKNVFDISKLYGFVFITLEKANQDLKELQISIESTVPLMAKVLNEVVEVYLGSTAQPPSNNLFDRIESLAL